MRENIVVLNNVVGHLDFTVYYNDYHSTDSISLKVDCAEDIENMMKLFFGKKWEELFDNDEIVDATFDGIELYHKDERENQVKMYIYGNKCGGSTIINYEVLADKNADKIRKIREIINE
jgi:hypothetical protein